MECSVCISFSFISLTISGLFGGDCRAISRCASERNRPLRGNCRRDCRADGISPRCLVCISSTMSGKNFKIETLVFPGVFPRGHPRCTQKPTDRLEVVVNKYSPRNNPEPKVGDVSLVLLHANGFHKVCSISWKGLP